jgi:hypothetical protein
MKYAAISTNTNANDRSVALSSFGSIFVAALMMLLSRLAPIPFMFPSLPGPRD